MLNYDIEHLQKLLDSFNIILGIHITVFDEKSDIIACSQNINYKFCDLLRKDSSANDNCISQDQYALARCRETNSTYSYICHAGFTEVITPIKFGNIIIGYLMFGRILQHSKPDIYWEEVRAKCSQYDVDIEELHSAYREIQPKTQEQIYAAEQLLEACAVYLWLKRHIFLNQQNIFIQIDEYITNNLDKVLSTKVLCEKFGVSRSTLYRMGKIYYMSSVKQFIKQLRVNKAKELLVKTNLLIKDIAVKSGYSDCNYFIKVFKDTENLTPVQYRKAYFKNTEN
jgi:AraC-like DNA-binding protein